MKKNIQQKSAKATSTHSSGQKRNKRIIEGYFFRAGRKPYIKYKEKNYAITDIKATIKKINDKERIKVLIELDNQNRITRSTLIEIVASNESVDDRINRMIEESNVRSEFAPEIINEAKKFGARVSPKEIDRRQDLTKLSFCTIDGETAKDFDDAVFARKKGKNLEVFVAIADVSNYVKNGSKLDVEALERGTSIYYPGHCIPMLPESLSNGLCSLKPNALRLAITVSFELGPKGGIFKPTITETVIKSKARLTYTQVQDFFDKKDLSQLKIAKDIQDSLRAIQKAALILRRARRRRGAIDFDITESVIALDVQGEPTTIHPQDRLETHRIIEDLMVCTNEIVAEYFERKNIPTIYRVHEAPNEEKLESFFKSAHAFGVLRGARKTKASSITEPRALQEVMAHYKDSNYKETLNNLMLRAMMQARYSEENLMHFGLASTAYLHFTSPIRRYADLMVHRQLRNILFEKNYRKKIPERVMAKVAEDISLKEVKATDLERKIDRMFQARFMASKVGETFEGTIISCTEFGFFVRVSPHHVEGLVHIATISRRHVVFDPEKLSLRVSGGQEQFMVGDTVTVRLKNVNKERGHIDFELDRERERGDKGKKKSDDPKKARRNFPEKKRRQQRRPKPQAKK